jgi:hypothetical protein
MIIFSHNFKVKKTEDTPESVRLLILPHWDGPKLRSVIGQIGSDSGRIIIILLLFCRDMI